MKKIYLLVVLISFLGFGQNGKPYQIYNSNGKKVSFEKMIKHLKKEDIVLFGEFHNNSLGHWLQLQTTKALGKDRNITLGAEMFEADNREGLTAYVKGKIGEKEFAEQVRLWDNYKTDYKPLVEYAKANNLEFIATNVPRRFANLLYKKGVEALDSLSVEEKEWIAPLPFPYDVSLPGYQKMLTMFEDHQEENLPKAQAIKDATMGYFISKYKREGKQFIHYNGSYHSNNFEGIVWYLNQYAPKLKVATITMVDSKNVDVFEKDNLGLANFIIVIDANILKSF